MPENSGFSRMPGAFFARVVRWLLAAVLCLGIFFLAAQAVALVASALALLILVTCLAAVCFPAESREVWQWARDALAPSGRAGEGSPSPEPPKASSAGPSGDPLAGSSDGPSAGTSGEPPAGR